MNWALALVAAAATVANPPHDDRKPLIRDGAIHAAKAFAKSREGSVSFVVIGTGHRLHGYNTTATYPSASVAKAMLLVKVLRNAHDSELTAEERRPLVPMITESKNPPARKLFARIGSAGLYEIAELTNMQNFSSNFSLFESRITAADQARFFFKIDRLTPERHRVYARDLLSGIIAPHQWGIPPAARKRHMRWFVKGGWRSDVVHQVALLERDRKRRVALAVLSATTDQGYGRATVAGVARRILRSSD